MARAWITSFRGVGAVGAAVTQAPIVPPLGQQHVDFVASVASDPIPEGAEIILVHPDDDCHVEFGNDPVATTESMRLPAGSMSYFTVGGRNMRLAFTLAL